MPLLNKPSPRDAPVVYGVRGWPTTYVIGRDGRIVDGGNLGLDAIEKAVAQALARK